MLAIAGQTAGPNGLAIFEGTHGYLENKYIIGWKWKKLFFLEMTKYSNIYIFWFRDKDSVNQTRDTRQPINCLKQK